MLLLLVSFFSCTCFSQSNEFTWLKGSTQLDNRAVYGIKGIPGISNNPGAGAGSAAWKDHSGNFWLFGGSKYIANIDAAILGPTNDLWKYSPTSNQWTWMSGSPLRFDDAVFGIRTIPARANKPGGRWAGCYNWTDTAGNFWLFGGSGVTSVNYSGTWDTYCNDLWKYDVATNQWAWENGDTTRVIRYGVYGVLGITAIINKPGGRQGGYYWTDRNGDFWLFGGYGYAASGAVGYLNDLWKYDVSNNLWTWLQGDSVINARPIQGSINIPSVLNKPGGRGSDGTSWTDSSGNFWLFGGIGCTSSGATRTLADLWKYSPITNEWVWIKGDTTNLYAVYGTMGIAAPANKPGAMFGAIPWTDNAGNLWMINGGGYSDIVNLTGYLNTTWKYNILSNEWTFMNGSHNFDIAEVYGIQGITAHANRTGSRISRCGWLDDLGNFWFYGGVIEKLNTNIQRLYCDLWKYTP